MTYMALGRRAPKAETTTAWEGLHVLAGAFLFLAYSQAWIFPLFGDPMPASAGAIVRLVYLPAYLGALLLAVTAPNQTFGASARQPFLILLLGVVAASVLWSVAPADTARRTLSIVFTTLGGLVLAARWRWARLSELLGGCFALLAVISLITALVLPRIGIMHDLFPGAWRGTWPEKNALGGNLALGFVVLAAAGVLNPRRARLWWGFAALAFFLVLMSTSKTSLVSLMVGFAALIFVVLAQRGPALGAVMVWLAVVGLMAAGGVMLFAADAVFGVLGKDATLTGRTRIWDAAMRQIAERPWTGYGYGAIWDEKGPWGPLAWIVKDADFKPQHAHNAWIEQWLGTGIFGLAAFAAFYAQAVLVAALSLFRERGAVLAIPVIAVYSLMSLTESVAVTIHDFRWVLFVVVAVKLAWPDAAADEAAYRPTVRAPSATV